MSKMEKRLNVDFNSLIIHQLYTEIAPALVILEENIKPKSDKHSLRVNEYVSMNPIKVIENGGKYEIISGVSQYLKVFRKVQKINVTQIQNSKHYVEAVIAADILTSDLHLWHPQALIIHTGVLLYLQKHPNIASKVEEMTWLKIIPINDFLNSSSLLKRSVYYELKQKHYSNKGKEKRTCKDVTENSSKTISISGKLPMRIFTDVHTDALLNIDFDSENQLVSAQIVNSQTIIDITGKVSCSKISKHQMNLAMLLEKEYFFEIYFLNHIDFIGENSRLVLTFNNEKIKKGKLFTNNQQMIVSCSELGEIVIDHSKTAIGKLTNDCDIYFFQANNRSNKIMSSVKNVLIRPTNEVRS